MKMKHKIFMWSCLAFLFYWFSRQDWEQFKQNIGVFLYGAVVVVICLVVYHRREKKTEKQVEEEKK